MIWLLAGAAALLLLLLIGQAFAQASVRQVKQAAIGAAGLIGLAVLALFVLSGRWSQGLWALFLVAPMARRAWHGWLTRRRFSRPADASTIETATLSMHLDLATGVIAGTIRRGHFAGADLAGLDLPQLLALRDDCQGEDPESLPLLETWLDRSHPGWRAGTAMDRAAALATLGLAEGATPDDIRAAHHRLMRSAHPDHGGSDALAARLNEARAVLERG